MQNYGKLLTRPGNPCGLWLSIKQDFRFLAKLFRHFFAKLFCHFFTKLFRHSRVSGNLCFLIGFLLGSYCVFVSAENIRIISEDSQQLLLELSLPPFDLETLPIEESPSTSSGIGSGFCNNVKIPTWATSEFPSLPVVGTLLQVPEQGEITVQLVESNNHTLSNITLCHLPPTPDFYPKTLFNLEPRAVWRGLTVSRLTVIPFQWSATTKELRYFSDLRLQIHFEQPLFSSKNLRNKLAISENDENLWQSTILNYHNNSFTDLALSNKTTRSVRKEENPKEVLTENRSTRVGSALRIAVNQTGIYRISYQQLVEAGLPTFVSPQDLSLTRQGREVALKITTAETDRFSPGDTLEFYGMALDTDLTDTQVYWLSWFKRTNKPLLQRSAAVTGQGQVVDRFYERLHFEENHLLWEATPGSPAEDYWFWQQLDAPNSQSDGRYRQSLAIPNPVLTEQNILLRVALQGRSTAPPAPNHHTLFLLNGKTVGEQWWHGPQLLIEEMNVATASLNPKNNTLTIKVPGDVEAPIDSSYLNWVEIDYWRHLVAVDHRLTFTLDPVGKTQVTVEGFKQAEIIVYDITHPLEPVELVDVMVTGESKNYQVTFEDDLTESKTYYVTTQILQPLNMTIWKSSNLKSLKNGADYLLITAKEFLPAVAPLITHRQNQGLRARAVSVEDIYDEFNEGLPNPVAIKNFLKFAYQQWIRPAPLYVLLVGDATLDYRGYLGRNKTNKVLPHIYRVVSTTEYVLIPDDNWYVSLEGDDIFPEMLIGRIPGDTPKTVTTMVNKMIDYENNPLPSPQRVLLIADEEQDFNMLSERLLSWLPDEFTVNQIYALDYLKGATTTEEQSQRRAEVTSAIIEGLNQGHLITHYIGHGTINQWWQLFKSTDIDRLEENDHLTFALMLTCINGYFSDPERNSLAESFMTAPRKGTIAAFSPSGTSYTGENDILSQKIFARIFDQADKRLGSITTQAKVAAFAQGTSADVIKVFTLFGDPALKLRDWIQ